MAVITLEPKVQVLELELDSFEFTNPNEEYSELELVLINNMFKKYSYYTILQIYEKLLELGFKKTYASLCSKIYSKKEIFEQYRKSVNCNSLRTVSEELSDITKYFRYDVVSYARFSNKSEASRMFNISYSTVDNRCNRFDGTIESLDFDSQGLAQSSKEIELVRQVIDNYPDVKRTMQFEIAKTLGYSRSFTTFKTTFRKIREG